MADGIQSTAADGFTKGADAYERGRPSYPAEAVAFVVDRLRIGPGSTVLDLAAGTGKFTALLVPSGARVVAVEPVAAMRAKLPAAAPSASVLDGTAEAIPLPDASVDAVAVAQAFHWFRAPEALAEIARVLRPGGGLALVWNSRDASVPWVAELHRLIRWNRGQIPTYDAGDERWIDVIGSSGRFGPVQMAEFPYDQPLDRAGLVDRVTSTSYIAAMAPSERDPLLASVLSIVDREGFGERFVLPHRTFVYWCTTPS